MDLETRKPIERQLAEKVLGATAYDWEMPAMPYPQIEWGLKNVWLLHLDYDSEVSIEWSPLTNFHDAFALLGRLVEAREEGQRVAISLNTVLGTSTRHASVDVFVGRARRSALGATDAEALTLAICEVLGISTEDDVS